jgi:hypothetical protein
MAYFTLGGLPVYMMTNVRTDRYGNPIPYVVAGGIMMPVGPTMHTTPAHMPAYVLPTGTIYSAHVAHSNVPVLPTGTIYSVHVAHSNVPVTPTIPIHTHDSYRSSVIIPPPPRRSRMEAISGNVPTISWLDKMVCAFDTLKGNVPYIMERTTDSALRTSWYQDAMNIVCDVTMYMMSPHLQDEHKSQQHYNTMHLLVTQGNAVLLRR